MRAPKTIGIDASRANVLERTGTEWYSWNIIAALAAIAHRPKLELYFREDPSGVELPATRHTWIRRDRLWTHVGLAQHLRSSPVDTLFIPAHVIPPIHPAATVVTVHDIGYRYEPEAHTSRGRLMLEAATRWNIGQAARVIVPSSSTGQDLERVYGTDPDTVDIIPHGVDHDRFKLLEGTAVTSTLAELGVQRPYVLFMSTIQPRKNLSRLISAFESLNRPGLQLVIAGMTGWKSGSLVERFERSERSSNICHLGYVSDNAAPALYNGAEAFVLPSLYEGFGMGVLEAMACGCPVVTSSTSSFAEVAGGAAIMVDPTSVRSIRDGIAMALDLEIAGKLRASGLDRARNFNWQNAAQATLESIERAYRQTRVDR